MNKEYISNIWKFYLFKILSSLELTVSFFVLFFLANGLSMTQVMTIETIFIILVLVLEVPSGALADIFGRKLSINIGEFCAVISFFIFSIGTNFWTFLIAQIFLAFTWALMSGADSAFLYDSLKEAGQEKKYSLILGRAGFLNLITWSFSALLSGFLAIYFSYRLLFFVTSIIYLFSFFTTLFFKEPPIHKKSSKKNYRVHLIKAIKFVYTHKKVKNLIIYYGLFAATTHLIWFLIQPFYDQTNLPKYIIGIAIFIYFISAGIGNLTANYFERKFNEEIFLFIILFIAVASIISLYFVSPIVALLSIFLMSLVSGMRDVFVNKGINENTDSHHRATVISIQNMSKSIMYGLVAPLIGYFTDIFSASATFLILGICLSSLLIYFIIIRTISKKSII